MHRAAAAVLVLVFALPAVAAPPRRAALRLESTAPLVVSGRHFGSREGIVVTYAAAGLTRRAAGVRAQRNGGFRYTFAFSVDRCAAFTIRAVGLRGSRAVLQVDPRCKKRKGPPKRALSIALSDVTR
ncbi:MAG: hypothetical protein ACRDNB_00205 [Gaiellaceae bacterium]